MPTVNLDANEWGQVMAILATAPWRDANPLLMKIGEQLRLQQQQNMPPFAPPQTPQEQTKREDAHSLDGQGGGSP